MNILVLVKMVPDIVEELEVGSDGTSLDPDSQRPIVSERDEHALEQALLLKERCGGTVTTLAIDCPEVDGVLFTALARGCDRVVKVTGVEGPLATAAAAALLARALPGVPNLMPVDLILACCQAIDDIDALLAPALAERLGLPYLGIVTGVAAAGDAGVVTVTKEYAGGVRGEYRCALPAVLGIQAAEKPPRYVPVAKVRATMKSAKIEEVAGASGDEASRLEVLQMTKPVTSSHAEMLEGSPEDVAARVADLLAARGLL